MTEYSSIELLGFDIKYFQDIICPMKLLSTAEAASTLGVTIGRVQQLIWDDLLPAQKVGRDYVINEDDLKLVEDRPKVGRPPKAKAESTSKASNKKGGKK
jgi:excisionase family DNA binding protein